MLTVKIQREFLVFFNEQLSICFFSIVNISLTFFFFLWKFAYVEPLDLVAING